ncbi:DUF2975 domain-containing protein [Aquirufa sp. ROCK-SH2]
MSKGTDFLFKVLNVLAWIIFIGLCIDTGGLIVNAFVSIFINPVASSKFWGGMNLYELYQFNESHFITIVVLMIIVSMLKSTLFYLIINLFHQKKLNLSSPFNETMGKYIFNLSYLSFGIGLFIYWGKNLYNWLKIVSNDNVSPSIQQLKFEGADVWLFMGVILLIFALIFKKGIELQSENDLTV